MSCLFGVWCLVLEGRRHRGGSRHEAGDVGELGVRGGSEMCAHVWCDVVLDEALQCTKTSP